MYAPAYDGKADKVVPGNISNYDFMKIDYYPKCYWGPWGGCFSENEHIYVKAICDVSNLLFFILALNASHFKYSGDYFLSRLIYQIIWCTKAVIQKKNYFKWIILHFTLRETILNEFVLKTIKWGEMINIQHWLLIGQNFTVFSVSSWQSIWFLLALTLNLFAHSTVFYAVAYNFTAMVIPPWLSLRQENGFWQGFARLHRVTASKIKKSKFKTWTLWYEGASKIQNFPKFNFSQIRSEASLWYWSILVERTNPWKCNERDLGVLNLCKMPCSKIQILQNFSFNPSNTN